MSTAAHWVAMFPHKSAVLPVSDVPWSLSVIEFLMPTAVIDGTNEFTHTHLHTNTHSLAEFLMYLQHGTSRALP